MTRRIGLFVALALVVLAASAGATASPAQTQAKGSRLVAFRSCGELLGYVRAQAAKLAGPYGLGGAVDLGGIATGAPARSAAVQGVDYSGTNVQEEGVDEPDLVKTDGNTLFVATGGKIRAVDVSGEKPRL